MSGLAMRVNAEPELATIPITAGRHATSSGRCPSWPPPPPS